MTSGPKLICIDLQPNTTTQAPERSDILNVGGFSDAVFVACGENGLRVFSKDGKTWTNLATDREGMLLSCACFFGFIRLFGGVSRDRGGFSKVSLRCPMVARRRNHLLQYPCQEKRRQAQLGSKLPRNLLDSDAPKACQPWPRFSAKGLFGTGTLDIGAMPPKIHMPSGNPKSPQIVG